jgi:hypothetical protein
MPALFRPPQISCFFCQQAISPAPRDPRAFRCPHCTCLNRYDSQGEILSDEPAMHDETLNSRSFAKRGECLYNFYLPSRLNLFPSVSKQRSLAHYVWCKQTYFLSHLSNKPDVAHESPFQLPPPSRSMPRMISYICYHTNSLIEDPEYSRRLETLPNYRISLHARYPPVCETCLPAVEDEIRSKDHMARTKALGGWLKQSKGKEKQRKVSASNRKRERLGAQLAAWKVRGTLWVMTLLLAVVGNSTGETYSC